MSALPAEAVIYIMAEVPEASSMEYQRLNVTLPAQLVQAIDRAAVGNRSGWLALAAKEKLRRDHRPV